MQFLLLSFAQKKLSKHVNPYLLCCWHHNKAEILTWIVTAVFAARNININNISIIPLKLLAA